MEASSRAASRCFMFMYFLLPHWVPATWRSRAQTSINAEFPSGKAPTTLVLRRISRFIRSITLLVRIYIHPMLRGEVTVGQRFLNAICYFLRSLRQLHSLQLRNHCDSLLPGCLPAPLILLPSFALTSFTLIEYFICYSSLSFCSLF